MVSGNDTFVSLPTGYGKSVVVSPPAQGRSQKSSDGGAKILERKPHLLINAGTGSNYYKRARSSK